MQLRPGARWTKPTRMNEEEYNAVKVLLQRIGTGATVIRTGWSKSTVWLIGDTANFAEYMRRTKEYAEIKKAQRLARENANRQPEQLPLPFDNGVEDEDEENDQTLESIEGLNAALEVSPVVTLVVLIHHFHSHLVSVEQKINQLLEK